MTFDFWILLVGVDQGVAVIEGDDTSEAWVNVVGSIVVDWLDIVVHGEDIGSALVGSVLKLDREGAISALV